MNTEFARLVVQEREQAILLNEVRRNALLRSHETGHSLPRSGVMVRIQRLVQAKSQPAGSLTGIGGAAA